MKTTVPPPTNSTRVACYRVGAETWVAAVAVGGGEWRRVPGVYRSEREAAAVAAEALQAAAAEALLLSP